MNAVLLKPLPFAEPGIDWWACGRPRPESTSSASIADYVTYREESRTLEDVAIWNRTALTVTGVGEPERVDAISATFRLLPMLGVQPIRGRAFTP